MKKDKKVTMINPLFKMVKVIKDRDKKLGRIDLRLRRVEQHLGLLAVN